MTELFINGQLIDSLETEIALTLSSFKLNSLGTRKGSYSNVFELPKTNANKLLFQNCEIVTSLTNIPYQSNDCEIFVDGIKIVSGTAIIRETKDNYKLFISAGNSDFFKAIGSLKLKDIDLTEFEHIYNIQNVAERRETRDGFVYPNIDYGFFEFADLTEWNEGTILNRQQYFQPSMWIRTIIEKAFISLNYNLTGDLLDSIVYQSGVVLCKGAVSEESSNLAKYRFNINFGQLSNTNALLNFPDRITDVSILYADNATVGQFVYTPKQSSNEDFGFVISLTGKVITNNPRNQTNGEVNLDLFIYDEDGTLLLTLTNVVKFENRFFGVFNTYRAPDSGVLERPISFIYPQTRDDLTAFAALRNATNDLTTLRFGWGVRVDRGNLSTISFENLEFSIDQITKAGRFAGTNITVRPSNVLPQNETVGDLLITIANLEGVIFQVNEDTRDVRTSRIDRLINARGNALDWSNKLDLTDEPEIIYTLDDFAQSNIYKFIEDDKDRFLPPLTGQGFINVQNSNLQSEKILFESKFASVPVFPAFNGELNMGRVFTGEKYTFDGFDYILNQPFKIEDFKPRITVLSESESLLDVSVGLPTDINFNVNPLLVDFERAINDNYNLVRSVLVNTKVIKALFLLDLEDIVDLDFTRPIYIDYFGEYFYIESINQFKVNKRESCFVTLVRI
jgi:hypothetical protein